MKAKTAIKIVKALPRVVPVKKISKSKAFKKTAAVAAGVALIVSLAAGAAFINRQKEHREMAQQVVVMEQQRELAAGEQARLALQGEEPEKKKTGRLYAVIISAAGAMGAAAAAFLCRFLGKSAALAGKAVLPTVLTYILPSLFIVFALFLLYFIWKYPERSVREFFTKYNITVLCTASVALGAGWGLGERLIDNADALTALGAGYTLLILAAAWIVVFKRQNYMKSEEL